MRERNDSLVFEIFGYLFFMFSDCSVVFFKYLLDRNLRFWFWFGFDLEVVKWEIKMFINKGECREKNSIFI